MSSLASLKRKNSAGNDRRHQNGEINRLEDVSPHVNVMEKRLLQHISLSLVNGEDDSISMKTLDLSDLDWQALERLWGVIVSCLRQGGSGEGIQFRLKSASALKKELSIMSAAAKFSFSETRGKRISGLIETLRSAAQPLIDTIQRDDSSGEMPLTVEGPALPQMHEVETNTEVPDYTVGDAGGCTVEEKVDEEPDASEVFKIIESSRPGKNVNWEGLAFPKWRNVASASCSANTGALTTRIGVSESKTPIELSSMQVRQNLNRLNVNRMLLPSRRKRL